ncbi:dipeptidase PepE [Aestuariibacter sp. A3R04]|uniref:dipeptidase PepE n=1 Tax=Aestuariibacter sp. A3R04 TaxID=2841571 RepID=UPI001C0A537D|nr:dipeptidase PepE [Aestuariibacter sp. A3R04]MBU3022481.1 dipeptidase PepE [Aestuariibacter sp. A3R04]
MPAHVLMLSSSRVGDEDYLLHAKPLILAHLGPIRDILFVPYAGVTVSWDEYTEKVQQALPHLNIRGLHTEANPAEAVSQAIRQDTAMMVGGGNTFNLLHCLYKLSLIPLLKLAIDGGTPYIGWSAGSNICGATIRTTNDMPIIEPPSFNALDVLPCQLNPHYSDYHPPGFNGETRDQRLREFTALNPTTAVLAIREGTALSLTNNTLTFKGKSGGYVFLGKQKKLLSDGDDLSQYLHSVDDAL